MRHMTTGLDLKLERVARDVSVTAISQAMGVSVSRISQIERLRYVTDKSVTRYRDALATLATVATK